PPSLHFERANPRIDLTGSPFYINTRLREWKNEKYPLRAGVSSFGIGGTNAHVIVEEAPAPAPTSPGQQRHLLVFSARTHEALQRYKARIRKFLQESEAQSLSDIAYTLHT